MAGGTVLALILGLFVQQRANEALRHKVETVREQHREIVRLRGENERLAGHVAEVGSLRQDDAELARLEGEATALQQRQAADARAATEARWRAARVRLLNLLARYDARHPSVVAQRAEASALGAALGMPEENFAVYDLKQLDQMPAPKASSRPAYPFELRRDGIPGEVVVSFLVGANGEVTGVRATKSTQPEFESAAVEAIKKWKFTPGQRAGFPVNARVEMPIVFTLGDASAAPGWF